MIRATIPLALFAQAAHAQSAPPAPTQSAPVAAPTQSAPTQSTPTQPAPAQSTPTQPTPAQTTPAQTPSTPTQATPAQPTPAQPAPMQPRPGTALPAPVPTQPAETAEADVVVPVPDEAELGEEIIVVTGTRSAGTQRDSAIATRVVTRDQIEGAGAQTAAQALAMQPGVWISRGLGGAEASLHGLGGKYVLVLVDGQRQIGRVDGVLDLDRLSVADVQQIEVVTGPSSSLYGSDAIGGVINLVRRVPGEDRLHLTTRYATDGASDLAAEATFLLQARFYVAATGQWRRAPAVDRDDSDVATTISEYDERRTSLRAGFRPGEGWLERVELEGKYLWRDLRGVEAQPTGAVFDRHNLVEEGGGRASAWFGDRVHRLSLAAGATLVRDQFLYDQRGSTALDKDEETRETLLESSATYERTIAADHRASAGLELLHEAQESPRLSHQGDRTRFGMFAQDQWTLHEQLTLVPAARLDADSQFGVHATPRLAALYRINEEMELRASAGFGYRAPSFKELYLRFENPGAGYVVDGNPELDPETSRTVSLDYTVRPKPWLALEASASWNQLRSQITTLLASSDDGGMVFSYGNIARARTIDGEAHAAFELLEARLRLEAGLAATHARDLDTDQVLSGVPEFRAQAAARWRDGARGLRGDLELAVTGPRTYPTGETTAEATAEATNARFDVRARAAKAFEVRALGTLEIFAGVDNLLDEGDANLDPVAPRTAYLGLSATR